MFKHITVSRIIKRLRGYPREIMIEPTTACNLRCPLCPTPQEVITRKKGSMSLDNFKIIVDKIRNYIPSLTLFFSGEPFLNKELIEMIKYASQKKLKTITSTNATLIKKEMVDPLLKSGLYKLVISFDGLTKESYEKYRLGADFDQVFSIVKNLSKRKKELKILKPILQIQFIVMNHNEKEVVFLKKFKEEIGVDNVFVKSVSIPTWLAETKEKKEKAEELKRYLPIDKSLIRYHDADLKLNGKERHCEWLKKTVVLWDGNVILCCYDVNGIYSFGNLLKDDFSDIWNSNKYREHREKIKSGKIDLCKKCSISNKLLIKQF